MNYRKHNLSNTTNLYSFDSTTQFLTVPDSLITTTRNAVFSTWQALEWALSLIDPKKEPDLYAALDDRAQTLFLAWLQFRYVERGLNLCSLDELRTFFEMHTQPGIKYLCELHTTPDSWQMEAQQGRGGL